MHWKAKSRLGLVTAIVVLLGAAQAGATAPLVGVVHSARWSQGDETREGAAEFVVLLEVARLKQSGGRVGLVAVGDRRGLFSPGAEEALQHAVRQGMPVVKLAQGGRVTPAPHGLFLDGGPLTEDTATQVLARCLERYGPLPKDDAALRKRLVTFQEQLTLASSSRLAAR
jgi:hypothetical protein